MERKRLDLIGQTGSITRRIEIIDAKEGPHGVDVRIETVWVMSTGQN